MNLLKSDKKINKIISFVAIFLILITTFFYYGNITHNCEDHDEHEECPICIIIEQGKSIVHNLVKITKISFYVLIAIKLLFTSVNLYNAINYSLIDNKVRMND